MKKVVVYNEKFDEVGNEMFKTLPSEDLFLGLSPDNTLGDFVYMLMEAYCKTIIGEEYLDMTLGEFMRLPKDEAIEKLDSIFDMDKRGYTETYKPVV